MRRREFLAGLLASTAASTWPVPEPQAVAWSSVGDPASFTVLPVMRGWSNTLADVQPLTREALDELAAAIRRSFEPEEFRRHLIARA